MSAKWTFMVYVAGYNNLTSFAGKDIAEMRKVGSGEELKVTVFVPVAFCMDTYRMFAASVHALTVSIPVVPSIRTPAKLGW